MFGNFSLFKTPFSGRNSVPPSFVSFFVFYIFSYLLSKTMDSFSGCLMSSAGIQKLFCGVYSVFKCSFDEFVGKKVFSPSYSSAILGPPHLFLFYGSLSIMPTSPIYVVTISFFPHSWILFNCVVVYTHGHMCTPHLPYLFICKRALSLFLHLGGNEQCYSRQGSAAGSGQTVVWQQLLNDIFSVNSMSLQLSTSCSNPASPCLSLPLIRYSSGPWCGWISCGKGVRKEIPCCLPCFCGMDLSQQQHIPISVTPGQGREQKR